jgi:hypothetical protein
VERPSPPDSAKPLASSVSRLGRANITAKTIEQSPKKIATHVMLSSPRSGKNIPIDVKASDTNNKCAVLVREAVISSFIGANSQFGQRKVKKNAILCLPSKRVLRAPQH